MSNDPECKGTVFYNLIDNLNITRTDLLSVDHLESMLSFSMYPNPSSDVLKLKLPRNSSSVLVEVFDTIGKKVYKSTATKSTDINIANWKTGLYFVNVKSDNYNVTKRFVKE